jgi:diguanylate cyclase (GGDEF)-like protein/PAS domain S-box-containing protein
MPVARHVSARNNRDAAADLRGLAPEAAPTIEWSVSADGALDFRGPAREVLGARPGRDIAPEVEALLAPILIVLRSDRGWDNYQLERTYDGSGGPRQLLIHCRRRRTGGGGHVGVIVNATDYQPAGDDVDELMNRYRLLVEISPDMVVVHQGGIVRFMNPTGLTWMAAADASEIVGRPLSDFVAASSFGALLERIATMDRPGAVSSPTELTVLALDGRRLLLEAQSVRTAWDGRPAFQVFLRDHSERRRAEAAVRYQANLLESVSDAVLATDLEGRITGWNPAAAELYRLAGPDALGRQAKTVLGESSITAEGTVRAGEVEHLRADGTTVAVRVAVAPLRDDMGQPCGEVAVCADQSYRLLAATERRWAEGRFTTVVTALNEGIVVIESDGTISSINPAAQALFGDGVAAGANALHVLAARSLVDAHGGPLPIGQDPAALALATGSSQHDRVFGFDDDEGGRRWWSMSCETLERRPDGRPASIVCSITDVTDRRASERRLTHAAAHDSLTGLANRNQLLDMLGKCLASGGSAAVLFVDLDRFKAINDAHGHLAGDRVLCVVASRIRGLAPPSATVGRLAGDEFVIVLPGATETTAVALAELIRERVAQPIQVVEQREVVVTASIGVASAAANGVSADALVGDADMAMYRAKQRGRSRIDVFDAALRAARTRRLDLADRLRRAVNDREVEVHYQPIIRFDTGRTVGYEALARWTDRDLGAVAPSEFIPVAEDHGLIVLLGKHVLLQACQEAATCYSPPGGHAPAISVNLSAHQLCDPHLPADVLSALSISGLPPARLCLEVTESVLMDDVTASIAVLNDLRSAGVRLVIDDFGTGYSSFSYLRQLPVDGIKIDRSFVAELGRATGDDAIVDAIIQLGHSLGLTITAEGVETPEQAAILRQMGCDTAQGYLYGRPSPACATLTRPTTKIPIEIDRSKLAEATAILGR